MSEIHVDIYTRARLIAQAERIKELEASLFLCEAANANAALIIRGLEADKMELKAKIGTLTDAQLEGAKVRYADPNLIGGVNVKLNGSESVRSDAGFDHTGDNEVSELSSVAEQALYSIRACGGDDGGDRERLMNACAATLEGEIRDLSLIAYKLRALLLRYRNEVPLGHQPHMIASEIDALVGSNVELTGAGTASG